MFWECSELAIFMYWTCNLMNNPLSYCGLVDARISASEKDSPVHYFNIVLKNTLLHSLVAAALSASAWARTLIFHVPFFKRWFNRFSNRSWSFPQIKIGNFFATCRTNYLSGFFYLWQFSIYPFSTTVCKPWQKFS